MKSVAAAVVFGLVMAVKAQDQCAAVAAQVPSCACQNTAQINTAALNCVLSNCGVQTGLAVQASASAVCDCVSSAGPTSQATESAPTPASTAAVQTAPGPVVSAGSSPILPTTTALSTSAAPATSSQPPYPTQSQTSDGQVQATGAASVSATGAVPQGSGAPFAGAGVKTGAPLGGFIVALVAAMVAM
ncbi:MAG: hypothetical protein Q9163_004211 [Psora crenata]